MVIWRKKCILNNLKGLLLKDKRKRCVNWVSPFYGLIQAPKQWHQKFDDTVLSFGFKEMRSISVFIEVSMIKGMGLLFVFMLMTCSYLVQV